MAKSAWNPRVERGSSRNARTGLVSSPEPRRRLVSGPALRSLRQSASGADQAVLPEGPESLAHRGGCATIPLLLAGACVAEILVVDDSKVMREMVIACL